MSALSADEASLGSLTYEEHGSSAAEKAMLTVLALGLIIMVCRVILSGANDGADVVEATLKEQSATVSWSAEGLVGVTGSGDRPRGSENENDSGAAGGFSPIAQTALGLGSLLPVIGVSSALLDARFHVLQGDVVSADGLIGAPPSDPTPLADMEYDGTFIGADGKSYPPGTPLTQIPWVMPPDGRSNGDVIIYTNGITSSLDDFNDDLKDIARVTSSPIIGVYNATDGQVNDLLQTEGDRWGICNNKAIHTLAQSIYTQLKAGNTVHLMGHSQGGVIDSQALAMVRNRLVAEGKTPEEAKAILSNVTVEVLGSMARLYPDGPRYINYVNQSDWFAVILGTTIPINSHAGEGAKVIRFDSRDSDIDKAHGLDTYLQYRDADLLKFGGKRINR